MVLGKYDMVSELSSLWQQVFGDGEREVSFFFRNAWKPENTLAVTEDGRVVSALHLLPCRINLPGGSVQAHYLYAAATLPGFRGRGYMRGLLEQAARYGAQRGDWASVLLPGEPSLYDYYHKHGYRTVFGVRYCRVEREELPVVPVEKGQCVLTGWDCAVIRNRCLLPIKGSVLWEPLAVQFAINAQKYWGKRMVSSPRGYCLFQEDGLVQELMAKPGEEMALLAKAARLMTSESLRVRLPAKSPLLPGRGEIEPFGMMRPLRAGIAKGFPSDGSPYLGLTME